ncbi:MAG: hypothetical protein U0531_07730 [Dehalococcoidia bacterium]
MRRCVSAWVEPVRTRHWSPSQRLNSTEELVVRAVRRHYAARDSGLAREELELNLHVGLAEADQVHVAVGAGAAHSAQVIASSRADLPCAVVAGETGDADVGEVHRR